MGIYLCDRCLHEHAEPTRKCEWCGAAGVWYRPSEDDILTECAEIRSTWSEAREEAARSWSVAGAVCVEVRTRARGRRVMREQYD